MLRFRGRRLQPAARLDPPWLGLPPWSGRCPPCAAISPSGESAHKAASFLSPPSSGRSPAPPTSSYLAPSPRSGTILRPSPSTCLRIAFPSTSVPLPSPSKRPARRRVGTAKPFRPPPALPSSTSAAVILPPPGAGLPLPSPPASSAFGQVWTARYLRPPSPLSSWRGCPPYTGVTLAAPGACAPPSPQASPPPGVMLPPPSICRSCTSPSTRVLLAPQLEKPARSGVGMAKPFLQPPALRSSTGAAVILHALGAGLRLPSPPPSSAFGQVGLRSPPPLSPSRQWPPYSGLTLAAPGSCPPSLQSPQASPLLGVMLPPATENVDDEMWDATGTGSEDKESMEEMMVKMKLTAAEEVRLVNGDEEDQRRPSWESAGLSQLASLQQQQSPMEPAKCLQLQGHRPLTGQRAPLTRTGLFSRSFASHSSPPAKKIVEFSPLSQHLAPDSVQSQNVGVYTKLKEFEFGFMKPDHIRATIADDMEVVRSQFDVTYLKTLYDEKIRDILVANGILVDPSEETYLAALDAGLVSAWSEVFYQKGPLYLTALDVMRTLVALSPLKWRHLLNYLRDSKIIVIERWDLSLGNVETMMYNHGCKYPIAGRTLYRGQTDASFNKPSNRAALCGITWNDTDVFDCLICPNIACKSNIEAELLSAVMLLRCVLDLKIDDFMLSTDCSHIDKVFREEIVEKATSELEELCKLLLGLKSRFRNIFCQLEAREKLMFPDCLLRLERAAILVFEEILRIWSPHLLGIPIFRIHQKRKKVLKDMIAKQASGGRLILHHVYRVKVKDESSKLDGLRDVVMGMLPKSVEVLVRDKEEAILVKEELKKLFTKGTLVEFQKRKKNLGEGYEVAVMRRTIGSTRQRTLRIVFHSSMEDVTAQRFENSITVKLLTPEESDESIPTLRPEVFLFFNGKPGELLDIEKKS